MGVTESAQLGGPSPWKRWAKALRDGDEDGFRDMVQTLFPAVRSCLQRKGMEDFGAAEEGTQDVFVWVWDHRCEYDESKSSLWTWIVGFAILRVWGTFLRQMRKPRAEPVDPQTLADRIDNKTGDEGGEKDGEALKEIKRLVHSAIHPLPDSLRMVLESRLAEPEASLKQLSGNLCMPLGTFKGNLHRAMQRVIQQVREQMDVTTYERLGGEQANGPT